ncbi:methyltransferase domain-containing protein [Polynucleobacter sp. HIN9]|uniref:methyltransferase domain-containing protein n=1 Tax=Polynucleobacter sp. HIN9 TaxID=3047868 RepID=UPI002572C690|nr:methyltransferase domain-containing protein [Polynucleobacter sp. HIN9]
MAAHGKDIMWVPTRVDTATQMLALAQVKPGDIVYDLGSGDGVIPIQAAKRYSVRAVGIEYNPDLVALSKRNAIRENVQNLVTFKQGDIFVEDFSSATVLTLFLGESLNLRLMPTILKMKPGTRVVSNTFRMESWIPDQEVSVRLSETTIGTLNETIYLWIVPANIDGTWEFTGLPGLDKTAIRFIQKKQFFDGSITSQGKRSIAFEDGRIRGDGIRFDFEGNGKKYSFNGQVNGSQMRGTLNGDPKLVVVGKRL